jgi:valyl-tRNA synthetase
LFAPFLPYATDEIWSWWQSDAGSIHRSSWPTPSEATQGLNPANAGLLSLAQTALFHVRKAKSDAKVSMKADVLSATLLAPKDALERIRSFEGDLRSVGRIQRLDAGEAAEVSIADVVLAPVPSE